MNYFSFGFVHFNTVEQKDKFFNFVRNKKFIGPSEKCIKFKLSISKSKEVIGDMMSFTELIN